MMSYKTRIINYYFRLCVYMKAITTRILRVIIEKLGKTKRYLFPWQTQLLYTLIVTLHVSWAVRLIPGTLVCQMCDTRTSKTMVIVQLLIGQFQKNCYVFRDLSHYVDANWTVNAVSIAIS
jgi:hypothetical protein